MGPFRGVHKSINPFGPASPYGTTRPGQASRMLDRPKDASGQPLNCSGLGMNWHVSAGSSATALRISMASAFIQKGLSRNAGRTAKSSRRPGGRQRGVMDDRPAPVRLLHASLRPSAQARPYGIPDKFRSNHDRNPARGSRQGGAEHHSTHRIWKRSNERARQHMQQMWYSLPP